ncbi:hypothetical protein, partial [uncultured Limnohabitans sp.]|uniref:hypothetical protein n=1 Tax=uncultured Limnohabitans sp. TaxID=768543 RepID=UPI00262E739B
EMDMKRREFTQLTTSAAVASAAWLLLEAKHAMAPTSNQEDVLVMFNRVRRLEEIMAGSFISVR